MTDKPDHDHLRKWGAPPLEAATLSAGQCDHCGEITYALGSREWRGIRGRAYQPRPGRGNSSHGAGAMTPLAFELLKDLTTPGALARSAARNESA